MVFESGRRRRESGIVSGQRSAAFFGLSSPLFEVVFGGLFLGVVRGRGHAVEVVRRPEFVVQLTTKQDLGGELFRLINDNSCNYN